MFFVTINQILLYIALFMGLYFAIFVFTTFFEHKDKIYYQAKKKFLPKISLIVPCYNEEKNLSRTIESLLKVDYPQSHLEIIIVDDGSTDHTLQEALFYSQQYPHIKVFHKKNGGKYTALNLGIKKASHPYIATVDADSYVHAQSLKKIMAYFENKRVMAVIATVRIAQPKSILEAVQYVEYLVSAVYRKAFGFLNSISVVPGPLSVFNKKVFHKIGFYKKAHQTEDLEFALRMQKANLLIAYAVDAIVYTQGCRTFKELLRQRLRWNRGFLLNMRDYTELLNIKKHGNLSFLLLNSLTGSVLVICLFFFSFYRFLHFLYQKINQLVLVKTDFFHFSWQWSDWIRWEITPLFFLGIIAMLIFFAYLFLSKKITRDPGPKKINVLFYLMIYPLINPLFWLVTFWTVFTKKKEVLWN
jgi:cellulose synthase/poly-beta-1,6-N-acetylglucosamine synthase-like glycosyltransferase